MPKLHEKIIKDDLCDDGNLLSSAELQLVEQIQHDLHVFQGRAQAILNLSSSIDSEITELEDEYKICNELGDIIINNIFYSTEEDATKFKQFVLTELNLLTKKIFKPETINFLKKLIADVQKCEVTDRWDLADEITETIFPEVLEEFGGWDHLLQTAKGEQLFTQIQAKRDILVDNQARLNELKLEIDNYKQAHAYDFDIDEKFNLVKISKRTNGLNFSVLYVADKDNPSAQQAYALYKGKEQILGEGQYGHFKLCQNIHTGEWAAVKIMPFTAFQDSKFETKVLDEVGRLDGINTREGSYYKDKSHIVQKYYVVQTLLHGEELKKVIDKDEPLDLQTAINIAKQAVAIVADFHKKFLHRDIKPDNFIWDNTTQTLYLCDFGYSCTPDFADTEAFGSDGYIAPEILATNDGLTMPYSIQSETYALGKTLEYMFSTVADVPDEINNLIDEMSAENLADRFNGDYSKIITRIESAMPDSTSVVDLGSV